MTKWEIISNQGLTCFNVEIRHFLSFDIGVNPGYIIHSHDEGRLDSRALQTCDSGQYNTKC